MEPLYLDNKSTDIDIDLYYNLFSNQNIGKPLGRKKNKRVVEQNMKSFLEAYPFVQYKNVIEQTKLWIQEKVRQGNEDYIPLAENFIYKKDKGGNIVGYPLLDLLNDPIIPKKFGLL